VVLLNGHDFSDLQYILLIKPRVVIIIYTIFPINAIGESKYKKQDDFLSGRPFLAQQPGCDVNMTAQMITIFI
jgi:hypothetical protein